MNQHEYYIKRCIELAKQGEGKVAPNPLVGAVVLDKNGVVIAEGYHEKYGELHAEANALKNVGEEAKGGTIYVSLEPCSHWGKTPPCADLIIEKGLKKLVVGMVDPNPVVAGRGIERCKNAGIEVITGVLEDECKKLNEIFIKHITQKKPFVAIKTACTMDGKIATKTGSSKWITSENARNEVQRLRNKYDAILTGSGTVIADNPSMNCRMEKGRNPVRIVVDSELKTSPDSKIYNNDNTRVIIAVKQDINEEKIKQYPENVEFIKCTPNQDGKVDLKYLINKLYETGITSILVEAGGILNGQLVKSGLVDKIYMFMAPKILGDSEGKSFIEGFDIKDINDSLGLKFDAIKEYSPDILVEGYFC